jgi:RNA polymerase sigma factor (sigma-70 family)
MGETMSVLIEPHIPALRRYAWALVHDAAEADDLVQDCLEHVLTAWHQRRPDGNVRSWMFAILHNLYISSVRRRARQGVRVGLDGIEASPYPGGQESHLALRDVLAALDQLPEEQKAVLLLVGVEDLSYEDAAMVLGIPVGTVMSRLSRGRERLRVLVEDGVVAGPRRNR